MGRLAELAAELAAVLPQPAKGANIHEA